MGIDKITSSDEIAHLLYRLSSVAEKNLKISAHNLNRTPYEVSRDCHLPAQMVRGGFKRYSRNKGDFLTIKGEIYLGSRDGWIIKFDVPFDENLAPNGDKISHFEIPIIKLLDTFSPSQVNSICSTVSTCLEPIKIEVIEPEDYVNDNRFGAWA